MYSNYVSSEIRTIKRSVPYMCVLRDHSSTFLISVFFFFRFLDTLSKTNPEIVISGSLYRLVTNNLKYKEEKARPATFRKALNALC